MDNKAAREMQIDGLLLQLQSAIWERIEYSTDNGRNAEFADLAGLWKALNDLASIVALLNRKQRWT